MKITIFINRKVWEISYDGEDYNNFLFRKRKNCIYFYTFARTKFLPRGVIGNTSDSGSEESRFEPWRGSLSSKEYYLF